MAFFATRPISMMTPMKLISFSVLPVISSATTTPMSDNGNDSITASGAVKLPNCITSTMYISAMPNISAIPISLNTSCCSRLEPASSRP